MREVLKRYVIKIWPFLFQYLPKTVMVKRFNEKISLLRLFQKDHARWRVIQARKMGAKVGERCRFYSLNFFTEPYLIEIGNDVVISGEVIFITHDGAILLLKKEIPNLRGFFGKIKIGNNCFIGMRATILPNVEIGDNCIVGAGAVVTQSFPDNSVLIGNPAKVAFKTSMYTKMRKNSPYIVRSKKFPHPIRIADDIKKEMILKHFENLPEKSKFKRRNSTDNNS